MAAIWGHGLSLYQTSWIIFITEAISSTTFLTYMYIALPHLRLLWIQLLAAMIPVLVHRLQLSLGSRARVQRRLSNSDQGNMLQLTISYCILHLWCMLQICTDIAVRNFPFPFLRSGYFFQFKFQGTSSNDTYSDAKDRGNAISSCDTWETENVCAQHCLIFQRAVQKSLKGHGQRTLIWLPTWCHQHYVMSNVAWPAKSCLANLQGWRYVPFCMTCFDAAPTYYEINPFSQVQPESLNVLRYWQPIQDL